MKNKTKIDWKKELKSAKRKLYCKNKENAKLTRLEEIVYFVKR